MNNTLYLINNTQNITVDPSDVLFNCEDITNNGLYMIFIGYLLPLISPTMRRYLKDKCIQLKNFGNVSGKIVSLTEFGFEKIQNINNNKEMVNFIERISNDNGLRVLPEQIIECAWSFSGDTNNGKKPNSEQSWNKLLKEIDRLHSINVLGSSKHRKV